MVDTAAEAAARAKTINPPVEASDALVTQIAACLKPILSMRFQEKFTVEQLDAAIRDAVLRVPEKFKRVEKVRAVHRRKKGTDAPNPTDPAAVQNAPAREQGDAAVPAAQPPGS